MPSVTVFIPTFDTNIDISAAQTTYTPPQPDMSYNVIYDISLSLATDGADTMFQFKINTLLEDISLNTTSPFTLGVGTTFVLPDAVFSGPGNIGNNINNGAPSTALSDDYLGYTAIYELGSLLNVSLISNSTDIVNSIATSSLTDTMNTELALTTTAIDQPAGALIIPPVYALDYVYNAVNMNDPARIPAATPDTLTPLLQAGDILQTIVTLKANPTLDPSITNAYAGAAVPDDRIYLLNIHIIA